MSEVRVGSSKSELLPCPFCGGEGELYADYSSERDEYRWQVWHVCDKGPEGESAGYGKAYHTSIDTPWFKNREKAIEAWNTRAWTVADNDAEVLGDVTLGLFRDLMAADHETAKLWARSWPELLGEVVGE